MIDCGNRVLPDQDFTRYVGTQIACARPHVAVGQLEPGAREGIRELVGVFQEASGDFLVGGVETQRQVGGQHGRHQLLAGVMRMRNGRLGTRRHPLLGAGGTFAQFPLEAEQVFEVVVVPLGGHGGPGDFQAAGDGVAALAGAELVVPAETLMFDVHRLGIVANVRGRRGAVGLAEGVAAGDQRHRLLIVHRHAGEGLADVLGGRERVGLTVGTFGVDVDQPHLHRGQRGFEVAGVLDLAVVVLHQHAVALDARGAARIAHVATQPLVLSAPVHVVVRLPHVLAAAGEAERLEAHGLHGHVAGQDHQVGPADVLAVGLLDRPQQAARLVQADVVWPAVERGETLLPAPCAATAVTDAVGAGAMPGQANEQRAVVAEVGRPPLLGIGHQRGEVAFHRRQVQALEGFRVVERRGHRVRPGRMLAQQVHAQLVGPPVAVAGAAAGGVERAFRFGRHARTLWDNSEPHPTQ